MRNRTLSKNLAHRTEVVEDAAFAGVASADYVLVFRKEGANEVHRPSCWPDRLRRESKVPAELQRFRGWTGSKPKPVFALDLAAVRLIRVG